MLLILLSSWPPPGPSISTCSTDRASAWLKLPRPGIGSMLMPFDANCSAARRATLFVIPT